MFPGAGGHARSRRDRPRRVWPQLRLRAHNPSRGPWRCRVRLFLHLCLRALAGSTGMVIPDLSDLMEAEPACLPPGHPERLLPDVPPSAQERALWAQLSGAAATRY